MNREEFKKELYETTIKIGISLEEKELNSFFDYTNLLLEWNNKINLTAITLEKEIILKHYVDSLTINKYIKDQKTVMDIGSGAGFPGIPLKILNKNNQFILVDSLNKRINFLEIVKKELKLENIEMIHARVEDLAKDSKYRENIDIAVSRAVANLSTLLEYMLPFVKKDGICICMKGPNINKEIEESNKALETLGGKLEKVEKIVLPDSNIERNIVIVKKIKNTPNQYPRKAGKPLKQPIR